MGKTVSSVVNFANPLSNRFLGGGGVQERSTSQGTQLSSFSQFPDLQKAIAQEGAENIRRLSTPLGERVDLRTNFVLPGGTSPASAFEEALNLSLGRAQNAFQFPRVNEIGLYPQQMGAFQQAVRQATSDVSGGLANQGLLSPQNINAVAGQAAQYALPQFAGMIGQNVQAQATTPEQVAQTRLQDLLGQTQGAFTAAQTPEQITQNRFNQLLQLIGLYPGLLGGAGTQVSTGQQNFPPFLPTFFQNFAGGLGQGIGGRRA